MREIREFQIRREAAATLAVLLLIILFWLVAGFGAAQIDLVVWSLPLWVITGCIGTWIFAIALVYLLITKVFVDMDLEDDADNG